MKPTDVTDEINEAVCEAVGHYGWDGVNQKEIIAAAVNAVLGDPTPITAERLVARGWERAVETCQLHVSDDLHLLWDGFDVTIIGYDESVDLPSVKTIGQLRALEIGLGITPCP